MLKSAIIGALGAVAVFAPSLQVAELAPEPEVQVAAPAAPAPYVASYEDMEPIVKAAVFVAYNGYVPFSAGQISLTPMTDEIDLRTMMRTSLDRKRALRLVQGDRHIADAVARAHHQGIW